MSNLALIKQADESSQAYKEGEAVGRIVGMIMVAIIVIWGVVWVARKIFRK